MKFNIKGRKLGREKLINLVELEGVLGGVGAWGLRLMGFSILIFLVFWELTFSCAEDKMCP